MAEALRLFLVEDDDDFAYLMRRSLERAGNHVTVCHSGSDALFVLRNTPFSLVLLDQVLPDMAGLDLLQTLNREGVTTPVLFVTGFGDEQLATQVLRAGALDYVVKDSALAFLTDLPKRVHESVTRHRLQQSNRLLIDAIESARDGVMITDRDGTLLHVNAALEHMFGYERQEMLGQTPRIFKSGLHPREVYAELWRTILEKMSWQGEIVNRRKDGTLLDSSLTVSPLLDSHGQLTHFVGIYRDISERKHMERQLFQAQKMQSVGTLAGGVAHEFNNLLAGIQGYASLGLREKSTTAPVRDFLEFIVELADRAAHLTRQLLAFARKPALSRQPSSMQKLLRTTANLVQQSLKIEVNLHFEDGDDDDLYLVHADVNQLQQVLVNLSLNARDAMTPQSVLPVEFRLRKHVLAGELAAFPENVPAGDYVVIEVEDYGGGMTSDVLSQALDPFFTTKEVGQGTGLGLAVVFGIIQGHQGFLTIDSEIGKGTRVRLYLPRIPSSVLSQVGMTAVSPESDGSIGRRHGRILVIDDEAAVQDVMRRFLEIAGHEVLQANSAREALELAADDAKIDLVVLDLMIPREEGVANFRAMRQRLPSVPIVLCTGLVQAEQADQMLREGAAHLLRKPFRMNELWEVVNRALTPKVADNETKSPGDDVPGA